MPPPAVSVTLLPEQKTMLLACRVACGSALTITLALTATVVKPSTPRTVSVKAPGTVGVMVDTNEADVWAVANVLLVPLVRV